MGQKYITVEEVGEILQLQPSTIRAWIRKGKLPFYRIGNKLRFRPEEIDAFAKLGWHAARESVPYYAAWQKRKALPQGDEGECEEEADTAPVTGCPGKGSGN
jgi:excisionase family DNA binding protein